MPHRLCNNFSQQGWCRKEDHCTFAHGVYELHPAALAKLPPGFLEQPSSQSVPQEYLGSTDPFISQRKFSTSSLGQTILGNGISEQPESVSQQIEGAENFVFNKDAAPFVATEFNANARPFVPKSESLSDQAAANGDLNAGSREKAAAECAAPAAVASSEAPVLPGISRRQAPQPLTIGDPASEPRQAPVQSPTAATLVSPVRRLSVLAGSPKASMSPVASRSPTSSAVMFGTATSTLASWAVGSPKAQDAAASPTAQALCSPKVLTPSATRYDMGVLLKARCVAKKIEVGPPGLGMWAPTPTSAARNFGFQLPQPGYIKSIPIKASAPSTQRRGKGKAHA
jgi:hypothetical protein